MATTSQPTFVDRREGDTLINAVIGAVATFVLAFIPFSPILGGAIAGYLQGKGKGAGTRVGAISGLLASLPSLFVLMLVFGSLGIFSLGEGEADVFAIFSGIGIVIALIIVVFMVGMSALGGFIGAALNKRNQPDVPQDAVDEPWGDEPSTVEADADTDR